VKPGKADLQVLRGLVDEGGVRPVIDRTYSLDEAVDAVTYQDTGHARGKVVVTV
jgi:NADPH:quinone reductase-like Zn-dependent oxidoreductase